MDVVAWGPHLTDQRAESAGVRRVDKDQLLSTADIVYDLEPLRPDHPLRALDNVVLTPHLGYVTQENYRVFYGEARTSLRTCAPIRIGC